MAIYESKCTGGSCSSSPYPTYTQPACQCKELLDPVKFAAASSTEKEKMQEKYNIKLPYVNTTAEFNTFTVSGTTSPCYLTMKSPEGDFSLIKSRVDLMTIKVTTMPPNGKIIF